MQDFNFDSLLLGLQFVCVEAGKYIRKEQKGFDKAKIDYKGMNDAVSYVDKRSEEIIVQGLSKLLPQSKFFTEEATAEQVSIDQAMQEELLWIVDPLDGTTNFIHGIPLFGVSVALMMKGDLVVGCVYEPNRDEMFSAIKGRGAKLNDSKIQVSPVNDFGQALFCTGFPYNEFSRVDNYLAIVKHIIRNSHGLRRMGSASVDLSYVACGRLEGFFERSLKPWDVAAGALIVQEAGGYVSDFQGGENWLWHNDSIVAASKLHKDLVNVVAKYY